MNSITTFGFCNRYCIVRGVCIEHAPFASYVNMNVGVVFRLLAGFGSWSRPDYINTVIDKMVKVSLRTVVMDAAAGHHY